ncbi:MAG: SOUL family heme-binding protein [Methylophilaceae bacterium]
MAYEQPEYRVVKSYEAFEVREYAAYNVAEVLVSGPEEEAGSQAFPILAGYIFGKNKGKKSLEMTAPVTQSAAPEKMPMTVPVTQLAATGGFVLQFFMPSAYTLDTLPEPIDARVKLKTMPARKMAVIRYSWSASQSNYDKNLKILRDALVKDDIPTKGEPIYMRYNAPFTLPFLKRNEIGLELQ